MNQQERVLIDAIKQKQSHQVFFGTDNASIKVAITRSNGVNMRSVWLGRSSSIEQLKDILSA